MDKKVIDFLNELFGSLDPGLSCCPIQIFRAESLDTLKVVIIVDHVLKLDALSSMCDLPYADLEAKGNSIVITIYSEEHLPF